MPELCELNACIGEDDYEVNPYIRIRNPTVREVRTFGEDLYAWLIHILTQKPYDLAVELWDKGIDYQSVTDYDLFVDCAVTIPAEVSRILFGDLRFTDFQKDLSTGLPRLVHRYHPQIVIDEPIYRRIVTYLRYIHFISEKNEYEAGNRTAKKFLIERMRRKKARRKKDLETGRIQPHSQLFSMIRFCVNHPGFPYDYASVMDLRLSLLYESYYQLLHNEERQILLFNIWNGKIDPAKLPNKDKLQPAADLHSQAGHS